MNPIFNFGNTNKTNTNKYIKIENTNTFEDRNIKKKIGIKKGKKQFINKNDEKKK